MIIAIDGPAASGKGTIARRLAAHYGLPHLDTGLLYRATARVLIDEGLRLDDGWYNCGELGGLEGTEVQVKQSEADIGICYVFGLGGHYIGTAIDHSRLGTSAAEVAAARRELMGNHVPHPGILERRTASYEVTSEREMPIVVDGRMIGAATHFELRCVPDAVTIVV